MLFCAIYSKSNPFLECSFRSPEHFLGGGKKKIGKFRKQNKFWGWFKILSHSAAFDYATSLVRYILIHSDKVVR